MKSNNPIVAGKGSACTAGRKPVRCKAKKATRLQGPLRLAADGILRKAICLAVVSFAFGIWIVTLDTEGGADQELPRWLLAEDLIQMGPVGESLW